MSLPAGGGSVSGAVAGGAAGSSNNSNNNPLLLVVEAASGADSLADSLPDVMDMVGGMNSGMDRGHVGGGGRRHEPSHLTAALYNQGMFRPQQQQQQHLVQQHYPPQQQEIVHYPGPPFQHPGYVPSVYPPVMRPPAVAFDPSAVHRHEQVVLQQHHPPQPHPVVLQQQHPQPHVGHHPHHALHPQQGLHLQRPVLPVLAGRELQQAAVQHKQHATEAPPTSSKFAAAVGAGRDAAAGALAVAADGRELTVDEKRRIAINNASEFYRKQREEFSRKENERVMEAERRRVEEEEEQRRLVQEKREKEERARLVALQQQQQQQQAEQQRRLQLQIQQQQHLQKQQEQRSVEKQELSPESCSASTTGEFTQHWIIVGENLKVLLLDFQSKFTLLVPNIPTGFRTPVATYETLTRTSSSGQKVPLLRFHFENPQGDITAPVLEERKIVYRLLQNNTPVVFLGCIMNDFLPPPATQPAQPALTPTQPTPTLSAEVVSVASPAVQSPPVVQPVAPPAPNPSMPVVELSPVSHRAPSPPQPQSVPASSQWPPETSSQSQSPQESSWPRQEPSPPPTVPVLPEAASATSTASAASTGPRPLEAISEELYSGLRAEDLDPLLTCKFCRRRFLFVSEHLAHLKRHTARVEEMVEMTMKIWLQGRKLKCHICRKKASYTLDYARHADGHDAVGMQCRICTCDVRSALDYANHMEIHHESVIMAEPPQQALPEPQPQPEQPDRVPEAALEQEVMTQSPEEPPEQPEADPASPSHDPSSKSEESVGLKVDSKSDCVESAADEASAVLADLAEDVPSPADSVEVKTDEAGSHHGDEECIEEEEVSLDQMDHMPSMPDLSASELIEDGEVGQASPELSSSFEEPSSLHMPDLSDDADRPAIIDAHLEEDHDPVRSESSAETIRDETDNDACDATSRDDRSSSDSEDEDSSSSSSSSSDGISTASSKSRCSVDPEASRLIRTPERVPSLVSTNPKSPPRHYSRAESRLSEDSDDEQLPEILSKEVVPPPGLNESFVSERSLSPQEESMETAISDEESFDARTGSMADSIAAEDEISEMQCEDLPDDSEVEEDVFEVSDASLSTSQVTLGDDIVQHVAESPTTIPSILSNDLNDGGSLADSPEEISQHEVPECGRASSVPDNDDACSYEGSESIAETDRPSSSLTGHDDHDGPSMADDDDDAMDRASDKSSNGSESDLELRLTDDSDDEAKAGHTCGECGDSFATPTSLKIHRRRCGVDAGAADQKQANACLLCGNQFMSLTSLKMHQMMCRKSPPRLEESAPKEQEEPIREELIPEEPLIVLNNQGGIRLKLKVPSRGSEESPSPPREAGVDRREEDRASPEKQDPIKLKISLKATSPQKPPEPERLQLKLRGFASTQLPYERKEQEAAEPIKMCIKTGALGRSIEPRRHFASESTNERPSVVEDQPTILRLSLPKQPTISPESKQKSVKLVVPRAQAVVKDTPQVHKSERFGLAKLKIRVGNASATPVSIPSASETPPPVESVAKLRIRLGDGSSSRSSPMPAASSPGLKAGNDVSTEEAGAAIPKLVIRRNGLQHVASVRGRPYMRKVLVWDVPLKTRRMAATSILSDHLACFTCRVALNQVRVRPLGRAGSDHSPSSSTEAGLVLRMNQRDINVIASRSVSRRPRKAKNRLLLQHNQVSSPWSLPECQVAGSRLSQLLKAFAAKDEDADDAKDKPEAKEDILPAEAASRSPQSESPEAVCPESAPATTDCSPEQKGVTTDMATALTILSDMEEATEIAEKILRDVVDRALEQKESKGTMETDEEKHHNSPKELSVPALPIEALVSETGPPTIPASTSETADNPSKTFTCIRVPNSKTKKKLSGRATGNGLNVGDYRRHTRKRKRLLEKLIIRRAPEAAAGSPGLGPGDRTEAAVCSEILSDLISRLPLPGETEQAEQPKVPPLKICPVKVKQPKEKVPPLILKKSSMMAASAASLPNPPLLPKVKIKLKRLEESEIEQASKPRFKKTNGVVKVQFISPRTSKIKEIKKSPVMKDFTAIHDGQTVTKIIISKDKLINVGNSSSKDLEPLPVTTNGKMRRAVPKSKKMSLENSSDAVSSMHKLGRETLPQPLSKFQANGGLPKLSLASDVKLFPRPKPFTGLHPPPSSSRLSPGPVVGKKSTVSRREMWITELKPQVIVQNPPCFARKSSVSSVTAQARSSQPELAKEEVSVEPETTVAKVLEESSPMEVAKPTVTASAEKDNILQATMAAIETEKLCSGTGFATSVFSAIDNLFEAEFETYGKNIEEADCTPDNKIAKKSDISEMQQWDAQAEQEARRSSGMTSIPDAEATGAPMEEEALASAPSPKQSDTIDEPASAHESGDAEDTEAQVVVRGILVGIVFNCVSASTPIERDHEPEEIISKSFVWGILGDILKDVVRRSEYHNCRKEPLEPEISVQKHEKAEGESTQEKTEDTSTNDEMEDLAEENDEEMLPCNKVNTSTHDLLAGNTSGDSNLDQTEENSITEHNGEDQVSNEREGSSHELAGQTSEAHETELPVQEEPVSIKLDVSAHEEAAKSEAVDTPEEEPPLSKEDCSASLTQSPQSSESISPSESSRTLRPRKSVELKETLSADQEAETVKDTATRMKRRSSDEIQEVYAKKRRLSDDVIHTHVNRRRSSLDDALGVAKPGPSKEEIRVASEWQRPGPLTVLARMDGGGNVGPNKLRLQSMFVKDEFDASE